MVTGWKYVERDGWQAINSEEPWSHERLAAEIGRHLSGFDFDDPVVPVVEFQVPLQMINDPFEALRISVAGRDQEIGTLFPVVVRSLDRPADPHCRAAWQALWDDLTARGDVYDQQLISWVESAASGQQPQLPALAARACTALAYPLLPRPYEDPVLTAVIRSGVPVALWHRTSSARRTRRAALEEVLRARGLRSLPDVVLSQRVAARYRGAAEDHAGRDLVLLWDDPERVPAELQWHSPIAEGATA